MATTLKMVTAQIPENLFCRLETYAKQMDRSKSWVIRHAIDELLSRNTEEKTVQDDATTNEWDELFAMFQDARDAGETFEPPVRENIWKSNPILETDWGELADDAKNELG